MGEKNKDLPERKKVIIAGFVMLVVGSLFFIPGILHLIQDINSNKWLEHNAEIISVESHKRVKESQYDPKVYYIVEIKYKFTVNNIAYTSNFKKKAETITQLEILENKFKIGSNVLIYYNPQKPTMTRLNKGFKYSSFIVVFLGLIFIFISVIIIITNYNYIKQFT